MFPDQMLEFLTFVCVQGNPVLRSLRLGMSVSSLPRRFLHTFLGCSLKAGLITCNTLRGACTYFHVVDVSDDG